MDKISTEHPIVLNRACGHIVAANSRALELAGINKNTTQVENGHFDIDENGEPLGIFRGGNAIKLIEDTIPEPTVEEIKVQLIKGIKNANSYGITSIHSDDFGIVGGEQL